MPGARAATAPRTQECRRKPRGVRSPFAGARQLLDAADDQVLLQTAEPVHEHGAVEVIDLVLKATSEEAGGLDHLRLTVAVQALQDCARWACDGRIEPGHAEAAFLFELHAIALDEFRVDERQQIARVATDRDVADEDSKSNADLRRSEPDTRRRVHRLDHVVDEQLSLRRDVGHGDGGTMQHIGAVAENRAKHRTRDQRGCAVEARAASKRRLTSSIVAARCRSISGIESPPHFSSSASASTKHTIASPTTAAAGTAQTSLRSIAAGASCSVVRSTERSGFISVAIGFMKPVTRTSCPLVTPPSRPPALFDGRIGESASACGGRISSCTRDPGRNDTSGPRPIPTALMAWMHIKAWARRPSSLRSHWTYDPSPGGTPTAITSKAPPTVSPASRAASIAAIIWRWTSGSTHRSGASSDNASASANDTVRVGGSITSPMADT